eukprot:g8425.t1
MGALSKHKRGNNGSASNQPLHYGAAAHGAGSTGKTVRKQNEKARGSSSSSASLLPGSSTQRPKPQVCVECGETVLDLAAHLQSRHGHVCPCCKKRFGNRIAWHNHLRDVHNVTGKALAKTKIDEWLEKTATSSSPSEVFVDSTSFKPRTNSLNDFATKNPKLTALGGPQQGGKKKNAASTRTLRRARSVSFGAPDQHLLGRFACLACDDQPGEQNSDAPLFAGRSLNADSQVDPDDHDASRANFPEEMGTYSNPYPRIPRVTPADLLGDDDDL